MDEVVHWEQWRRPGQAQGSEPATQAARHETEERGTVMIGRAGLLVSFLIWAFLISSCGQIQTQPPTASPSASLTPSLGTTAKQVSLIVSGSGTISTYPWSSCWTTLRIVPSGSTPTSVHFPGAYLFPITVPGLGVCQVTGGPQDLPGAIPAGGYGLTVATYRPSDVPSASAPGATPDYGSTECSTDLTVLPAWSSVTIRVAFKDPGCTITVSSA
jgi:hypothetical protein